MTGRSACRACCRSAVAGILVAVGAAVGLLGCEPGDSARYYGTTRPRHGPDELWINLGAEPEWLDPGLAADSASGAVVVNLFAGLTQLHPVTLEPMPDVAKGWEVHDGGRRYVFHLRRSQWSDGTPVTAHDFVFAWRRVLDPATASRYAGFLYPIAFAEEAHRRALVLEGLGPEVTAEQVKAHVGAVSEVEKVVMAPGRNGAFVHLVAPEGRPAGEHAAEVIAALGTRPLGGRTPTLGVADGDVIGVRALSDHRLEVRLTNPVPYILSVFAFYTSMPVPRHRLAALRERGIPTAYWTRPEHIVTNGAYTLSEWRFRQYMVLDKNPRYWDAEHVRMPRVKAFIIESYNTTLNLYKAGELDHFGQSVVPAEFMDHLKTFDDYRNYNFLGTYFLWLNTAAPPLDDANVRRALSLAIDRESLVEHVTRGGQTPTRDLVPDGVGGYQGLHRPLFDPEAARAALAEAGYGPDKPLPPIIYRYNTSEGHKQVAEAVQQMWRKHLGVSVELANEEWKVYLKHLQQTEFQVARMGWIGDYADPNTFLEILGENSGNNHSNWSDRAYDALLAEANATLDPARRLEVLRRAEQRMLDADPLIPIYVYTRNEMVKPYVRGAFSNYESRTYFKYIWIDERFYDGVPELEPEPPPRPLVPDPAPRPAGEADRDAGVRARSADGGTVEGGGELGP